MGTTLSKLRRHPWEALLGVLMLASAVLLLTVRSKLGFMLDDWAFVISRDPGSIDDYLDPHNEHISIVPVAIFKLFLGVFGMSAMPLQVFSVAMFLLCVWALFIYLRPLTGVPAAVIGCGLVLFLGTAWEDLLWIFQLGFSVSLAAGIGALVLLRREDRRGDRVACLLLVLSIASNSIGVAFVAGAVVDLLLRGNGAIRRLWVAAVPAAFFVIWLLGWGRNDESRLDAANVPDVPLWVFNSVRLAIADTNGTFRLGGETGEALTAVICVVVIAAVAIHLHRTGKVPRAFVVALSIGLVFWVLAALNGRDYAAVRYQLPGVIFLMMIVAGAIDEARIRSWAINLIAVIAIVGVFFNLAEMRDGYRKFFHPLSDRGVVTLTALEISRGTVDPEYEAGMNQDGSLSVAAGDYFDARERYGTVALDPDEIADQTPAAKAIVDQVLVGALPITSGEVPAGLKATSCRTIAAGDAGSGPTMPLPSRAFTFRPDDQVFLAVGRYAGGAPTGVALAQAGSETLVRVPEDLSDEPWRIGFLGTGRVRVCGAVGPPG